ncbi:MAG: hypothetical protein AAFR14_09205 [Bacteroidota bacterium]
MKFSCHRTFGSICLLIIFMLCNCTGEMEVLLIESYPTTFTFDRVESTGMRTYFFTDSIIFQVDNLQDLDSVSQSLDTVSRTNFVRNGVTRDRFTIERISFLSATEVMVDYNNNGTLSSIQTDYILAGNVGSFDNPFLFNFKVNEDLSLLLSCASNIATRSVDTLLASQGQLIPNLDTFDIDGLQFQLLPDDTEFISGLCNPTNESIEMELYAREQNLVNNERIIIHKLDVIFTPE